VKLSRIIFKPKWQDKDAVTRLAAVIADADPELIAALPELTRTDPDARIRLAALKRLGDYERWRERSTGDADADVRRTARSSYIILLCSGAGNCPPLARLIAELETLSAAELETVATAALNRDLRAAALTHVTRPALFAERAGADPDPALRLMALERVTDPAVLQRIAERTRKSDKVISRNARERVEALLIGAGNADAIAARARGLCDRIESLLREPDPRHAAELAALEREWNSLGADVSASLTSRFLGALALINRMAAGPKPAAVVNVAPPVGPADRIEQSASTQRPDVVAAGQPDAPLKTGEVVASRARFDAALAAAAEQSRREHERRVNAVHEVEHALPRYAAALDAGDTASAQARHAELVTLIETAGKVPIDLDHQLAALNARLAELKRWQHWSNQRRRRTLCDEIETLPTAGLHPDAVATRVHEARAEWQKLDAMEHTDKAAPSAGLTRRFFVACQHALKPAQAYFEKRDTVRDAHRTAIEALLARAADLPAEISDWKALAVLRRELSDALRTLDGVSPRDRNQYARRIKEAIAAISPRLEARGRSVGEAKARLIEQAQALSQNAERGAARAARELQQQWTAIGEGVRSTDQKQWREFRAACDRVFAALDSERRQRESGAAALADQARALLTEARSLLGDTGVAADAVRVRRRELEAGWYGLAAPDRGLEREFRQAIEAIEQRAAKLARGARLSRYTDALERYSLLRRAEQVNGQAGGLGDKGDAASGTADLAAEFAGPLAACRDRLLASGTGFDAVSDDSAVRELLVRLEFFAGVASPSEDRELRMNHQVQRLSARMRGGASSSPEAELTALMVEWFGLPAALPDAFAQRFVLAVQAALATLT
jgi:hypothetical protein